MEFEFFATTVRHSKGGDSTRIEEAAIESDVDGVFVDLAVPGVALINSACAKLGTTACNTA